MKDQPTLANAVIVLSLVTGLLILSSCGTDVQQKEKEKSLKGEKITAQFFRNNPNKKILGTSACCSNDEKSSVEIYSVNINSSKAEELSQIIKNDLIKFSRKKDSENTSAYKKPKKIGDPNMEESIIAVDEESGRQVLLTPINDSDKTTNKYTFAKYNELSNTVGSFYYYTAKISIPLSSLEENPELRDNASIYIQIKDQYGNIRFSNTFTKDNQSSYQKIAKNESCMTNCFNTVYEGFSWWEKLYCWARGLACGVSIALACGYHCIFHT